MAILLLLAGSLVESSSLASPQGPTVTQGSATFSQQGSQLTIQTSDRAFINWQSFHIGLGQTTTFLQPSSSSVVWNRILDAHPSQILGNLNANGYVVLQNPSGFFVGGQAAISAHGLILTTTPMPPPDLSSLAPWQFNLAPPTASIINYGQIRIDRGGSAYLIAHTVENHGTISAPAGTIGLYSGKEVLLSERPDGRGLSAQVTLPAGSVDNSGRLIADGGTIAMHAQVVNQGGLVQANSVREVSGVIELLASDALTLGPGSTISARGDAEGASPGGSLLATSAGSFADHATATVNVAGGAQGGDGGQIEISAPRLTAIRSQIHGQAAAGYRGGRLHIDPENILLVDGGDLFPESGVVGAEDPPLDTLVLDVNSLPAGLSQIRLEATSDIELSTYWMLPDSDDPGATLRLEAGRNLTFNDGSAILAGRNWNLNFVAGTRLTSAANRRAWTDGIYLHGTAFLQTQNGAIHLEAGNEIWVDDGLTSGLYVDGNGITTRAGGSISVLARFGDVTTGGNPYGYDFGLLDAPYYGPSPLLGGVSTAAGGDVTLLAGGNITSFFPRAGDPNALYNGGAGAFGSEPGNVTLTAGGSVFGHYVLANGLGVIQALGGNVGGSLTGPVRLGFALSLIRGSWRVNAPAGDIYLQEVRNPNGVFNSAGNPLANAGWHWFDYDPQAALFLASGKSVQLTGRALPRSIDPVQILLPPVVEILAGGGTPVLDPQNPSRVLGQGGFVLHTDMTQFPSPQADLRITTAGGGDVIGVPSFIGSLPTLRMSDSTRTRWEKPSSFGPTDFGSPPPQSTVWDPATSTPAEVQISGDMRSINLVTAKPTVVRVEGDLINSGISAMNFHPEDQTSIEVAGKIFNQPYYAFADLAEPIRPVSRLYPFWDAIFFLLVNPQLIAATSIPESITPRDLRLTAALMAWFPSGGIADNPNPGFVYDPATLRFGYAGFMPASVRAALQGPLEILRYGIDGLPVVANGHFVTDPVTFVSPEVIEDLYLRSQAVPRSPLPGISQGGPGLLDIQADAINLGSSDGIQSWGVGNRYRGLVQLTPPDSGADIRVTVRGNVDMVSSRIASFYGGDVTVVSTEGAMDLGSQLIFRTTQNAFGIYTSGHSDVRVIAREDININGSRIAAYNGGDVHVTSLFGSVDTGSGGNTLVNVPLVFAETPPEEPSPDVATPIYGSGVVATSLIKKYQTGGLGTLPGDILIETPRGDIVSRTAGILQMALDGNLSGGPAVTLVAGTPASAGPPPVEAVRGNIDLGDSGLIGGTIHANAEGDIQGVIVSRQSSTIRAAQNFSGTLVAAGSASVSAGGAVAGTIVGISGVSASGGSISASLLSQNVSVGGGQSQSTLGSSATATATSQSAAQQASTETAPKRAADSADEEDEKKKAARPSLTRRVGRVTVILPNR